MSILREILKHKSEELSSTKRLSPLADLKARIADLEATRSFIDAITRKKGSPVNLIAELKKASPSKGLIREGFDPAEIIAVYNRKKVAAMSVLTEERYFGGRIDYLSLARELTAKPLLRKDFIFDEYQVYEARANGADAMLLIVAALERSQLSDLYALADELSLDCLIEVHDHQELETALYCNARIVGINNRNLKTLNINLNTTNILLKDIPDGTVVVSESGIDRKADVEEVEATRADAILVGTSIMKSGDMGAKIDELLDRN